MSRIQDASPDVLLILSALCDDTASQDDVGRLEESVRQGRHSVDLVWDYLQLHSDLYFELTSRQASATLIHDIGAIPIAGNAGSDPSTRNAPGMENHSSLETWYEAGVSNSIQQSEHESSPAPSPGVGFLSSILHGTVGYFSSGWPVAYLVATVICGLGLLIGTHVYVSEPTQVARQSAPLPSPLSTLHSSLPFVGRITGMVDCKWVQSPGSGVQSPALDPRLSSLVSLGDKFALTFGLIEITYDTGAKVILQGPVTYEVESATGGYLSIGKLTAKLEKKTMSLPSTSGGGAGGEGVANADSRLSTLDSPLFAVRTPTAIVTDLGTEFGVEVSKEGNTTSHVFRGLVRVQAVAAEGKIQDEGQLLRENESARVERSGKQGAENCVIVVVPSAKPAGFVREIPKQTIKILDLVDVVAGGDGFSGRRNRGIDPRNGRIIDTQVEENPIVGDGKYHRVAGMPFVDGIFIPHSDGGSVQLDSAGHTFTEFPATDNKTCNSLWAGQMGNESAELDGIDYASSGHGQLGLDANKGITFDLDAIRRANPGCKLLRFRGVTGNTEHVSEKGEPVYADVWVFVDGQVRFRRREISRYSGGMPAVVAIDDKDRFLTLVATDGGNGYQQDHILFGDPRLELVPVETAANTAPRPKR